MTSHSLKERGEGDLVSTAGRPGERRMSASAWVLGSRLDCKKIPGTSVSSTVPLVLKAGGRGSAVAFRFGVIVLFNLDAAEEERFVAGLADAVTGAFASPEREHLDIILSSGGEEGVDREGNVVVSALDAGRTEVLANVLAKSAVLSHYETRVTEVFERLELRSANLARRVRSARGRDVLAQIGEVFEIRARTVGRVEVADKPEVAWERPALDSLYERLAHEFELGERDRVLSRKLEILADAAEAELELLRHRQSLRVEWYIVLLILVEILLFVYELFIVR